MNEIQDEVSHEIEAALGDEQDLASDEPRPISINREGSGHTYNVTDTIGVGVVGLLALILLVSLLRSEARNRSLQAQLRNTAER
jgi:hypothetical protein